MKIPLKLRLSLYLIILLRGITFGVESKTITVEAFDAQTHESLTNFILDFTSCGFKVYESDAAGLFSMNAPDSFSCYVQISKPGYVRTDLLIDVEAVATSTKVFTVYLSRSSNLHRARVRNAVKRNFYIQEAKVRVRSLVDDTEQEVSTAAGGVFEVIFERDHQYILEVSHPRYSTFRALLSANELGEFDLEDIFIQPVNHPANDQSRWTSGKIVDHRRGTRQIPHFSLQVGATSNPLLDLTEMGEDLSDFGEVYLQEHKNIYRIRVGRYYSRTEAEAQLERVKSIQGYEDAFVTQTIVEDEAVSMEVHDSSSAEIMVRLASYGNIKFFDRTKVVHFGAIDILEKDKWKIAVIRGFKTKDAADQACMEAKSLGFTQAHLVTHSEGVIRKVQG